VVSCPDQIAAIPVKDRRDLVRFAELLLPARQAVQQFRSCEPYLGAEISLYTLPWATLETFDPLPSLHTPLGGCLLVPISNQLSPLPSERKSLLIHDAPNYYRRR
jgi:hypothetical protein